MDIEILNQTILDDVKQRHQPFLVIGKAGDVSTGVINDLKEIAIAQTYDLWFPFDGG